MFVTGPDVVKTVTQENVTLEELGGAKTHTSKSSVADGAFNNDIETLQEVKSLIDLLPSSNREKSKNIKDSFQDLSPDYSLDTLVPENANKPYDMKELINKVVDNNYFFEIQPDFAKNIITGFGRTGKSFGAVKYNVQPDMITMAKAITNGAQPMGAVGVSDKIYNAIVDNGPEHGVEFFHGYTYSGHPACVAASLATLDVYEKEDVFARAEKMSPYFIDAVFDAFQDIPIVTDVRADGMMAAFDLAIDKNPGVRGYDAQKKTFANGVHIKFTGDAGIVAPALIAEEKHIDEMLQRIKEVLVKY